MVHVARSSESILNKNRLRVRRVKLYFQRFPGTAGDDKDRAVKTDYRVRIDGVVLQSGSLAADGSLDVVLPGGAKAELEILGTTYAIQLLDEIHGKAMLTGQQRRLKMLAYYELAIDGKLGPRTDAAALDCEADAGLDPVGGEKGALAAGAQDQLETDVGE